MDKRKRLVVIFLTSLIVILFGICLLFYWVFGQQLRGALSFSSSHTEGDKVRIHNQDFNLSFSIPDGCEFDRNFLYLNMSPVVGWKGVVVCGDISVDVLSSITFPKMKASVEQRIEEIVDTFDRTENDRMYYKIFDDVEVEVVSILSKDKQRFLNFRGRSGSSVVMRELRESMHFDS